MLFKCKICGGSLDVKQGEKVAECEYCGVRQTIPTFIEPKIEAIYNRANNYLMHNEFDKAENLFNQILFDDNSNADAYWNVLMCRYGVSYVKDPATGKYIPTCNRTLYSPIFNDENYIKAIKYATEEQKQLFSQNAKTIDEIQKGILAVSRKEKPFDIFISYKETDLNGARTKDSIVAQDLYNKLTAEGYKVFFSRITLEDKIGTEYEPYIYAALASSKVMITVCSTKENIEAVWVKNEWSRFLSFAGKNSDKTLIPLYFDMSKENLPEEFAHIPAYDMKTAGFEQELIRGIKKMIPLPVMLLEKRKKRKELLKKIEIGAIACAIIGIIVSIPWFMKLPAYNAAMQLYYDKNYPEATWAFDELGGYRDSKEMKEKCALSWRKSLAVTCTEDYYITQNGTVETRNLGYEVDKAFTIDEHGKIISICSEDKNWISIPMCALYEDGYLKKTANEGFENIVQAINSRGMIIALQEDGKLILADNNKTDLYDKEFLKEVANKISKVENVIKFEFESDVQNSSCIYCLKSDKTLWGIEVNYEKKTCKEIEGIDKFQNIKFFDSDYSDITVITNNNELLHLDLYHGILTNEKIDADNIIDFGIYIDFGNYASRYYLTNEGNLFLNDKIILKDVVAISEDNNYNNYYMITRSGQVYSFSGYAENIKVPVYDEWIERLN